MKKLFILIICIAFSTHLLKAQCFQVSSILADACVPGAGCSATSSPCTCEGRNEMVFFKVGNLPISTSNITLKWPTGTNPYLGIAISNATTAAVTATLQSTVLGCGKIIEPPAGIIPANSRVLMVLSTDMCTSANSFSNLNDTLYLIFQNPGNFQGHFANANSTTSLTPRVISFTVTGLPACTGSVSYIPALLTNSANVSYSLAGSYSSNAYDGGAVFYDAVGTPTYANIGCNAPFIPLGINTASVPNYVCVGAAQTLTANITGGAFSYITWSGGAGTYANTTTTTTTNTYTPSSADNGIVTLSCTVTRTCGVLTASASTTFTLNVAHTPSVITSSNSVNICPSQSAVLSLTVTNAINTGSVLYTNWSTGSNSVTSISTNTNGIYTATTTGQCGFVTSNYTVNVLPIPTVSITPTTNTICSGASLTLTANASLNTYTWNTTSNSNSIVVTPTTTTFYQVNSANTCSNVNDAVTITVINTPTLNLNNSVFNICGAQNASIVATSAGSTYSWSSGQTTNSIVTAVGGVYTVTVINACGSNAQTATVNVGAAPSFSINATNTLICPAQQITLTPAGSTGTFTWSTGSNANAIVVNSPGIYTATLSNSCGTTNSINSITVVASNVPTISVSSSSNVLCAGNSITLTALSSVSNYSWSNGPFTQTNVVNSAGTYTASVSNNCGSSQATLTITQQPTPTISIAATSTSLCVGTTAILTATSNLNNYSWNTSATTNTISVSQASVYVVNTANSCGSASASVSIILTPLPTVFVTPTATLLCAGQNGGLLVSSNPANINYTWFGVGLISGTNTANAIINAGGTYTVVATDFMGCSSVSVITIASANTNALFTPNVNTGQAPLNVNFNNQSTGANTYTWVLGNGNTATTINADATFNTTGTYTVTLFASANGQCVSEYTVEIIVKDGLGLVPEVVTPNGDGKNDFFEIKGLPENYPNNTLQILNRWGNLVYSSTPYINDWNGIPNAAGKTGSSKLPSGTYYFILQLNDASFTVFKGFVQLEY